MIRYRFLSEGLPLIKEMLLNRGLLLSKDQPLCTDL